MYRSDEWELLARAKEHDDEAMTQLMEDYKSLVLKKARPLFLMGGDTDDLVQEGMIGLYKAICDYDPEREASFHTFAELCISRQIYSAIKKSNRLKNQPLNSYVSIYAPALSSENGHMGVEFMIDSEVCTAQIGPEEIVVGRESANNIRRELQKKLSNMERKVLSLYLNGMNYQEIASHMGKKTKSIDNALQRIRAKLSSVDI